MKKLRDKYGEENCVSQMVLGTYNTGYTIFDYDNILAIGDKWLEQELLAKMLKHENVSFSEAENDLVNRLMKQLKVTLPVLDLNIHKHRIIASTNIIAKLPKGAKDGNHALVIGFPGIGKTTMVTQECGYIWRSLRHHIKKDGSYKCQIIYYMTEVGAIEINGFKKLTGMNDNEFKKGVVVKGGSEQSTADFMYTIKSIHDEKMANQLNYEIDVMAADGTYKKTMAPTLLILDSFSALGVEKYITKQAIDYTKGKDGSKESDMMRAMQVKATMLNTSGLFTYCEAANIMIYFIGHIGNDMGDMMGHQQLQMNKGHNSKLGFKMKNIPQGLSYFMARNYAIYKSIKKEVVNEIYNRTDLIFGIDVQIEKQRGGEVFKDKTLPLIFQDPGIFNNAMSTFYYYHKNKGHFDFGNKTVDGIYGPDGDLLKITNGAGIDKVFNDPISNMIISNNLFRDHYINKVYSDDSVLSSNHINDMMSASFDYSSLLAEDGANDLNLDV